MTRPISNVFDRQAQYDIERCDPRSRMVGKFRLHEHKAGSFQVPEVAPREPDRVWFRGRNGYVALLLTDGKDIP